MESNANPILEAVFEIRFRSHEENVKELLLGLLYVDVKTDYSKVETLPNGFIPKEILDQNPELRYQPSSRLRGDRYSISLGEHLFNLSCARPYQGWENFSLQIKKILGFLKGTGLVTKIERASMKYVNLLPSEINPVQLNMLRLTAQLGGYDLNQHKLRLHAEIVSDEFTSIVQVIPQTDVQLRVSNETMNGLLLDIDTFTVNTKTFWDDYDSFLDRLHDVEKKLFYDIVTPESLDKLGLTYPE